MIGKVTRGKDVDGLLRYLYGPGRSNEHTRPHLVASWRGDDGPSRADLEPILAGARHDVGPLAGRMSLPIQLRPGAIDRPLWQCSMRTAPGDRRLTDAEWATVARDVVERTGFAPAGDPGGCRWVAVRHADDHIHVAVVLARQDGGRVEVFRDWPKVHAAARAAEKRFGLQLVAAPDRTAAVAPSRAEVEKAQRVGQREPARAWLAREVRIAAAGSTSREEFAEALQERGSVLVTWRESQRAPGELTGYAVGRPGDVDGDGRQVWFAGSKLAPDLSLPKLEARWQEVSGADGSHPVPRPRTPLTVEQRARVLRRAEHALNRAAGGDLTLAVQVAAGEVATTLGRLAEGPGGGPLTQAADQLCRAIRPPGGRRADLQGRAHPLRTVAAELSLLGHLLPGDAGRVLLLTAHLIRIADAIGRLRAPYGGSESPALHHPQEVAARRAVAAYGKAVGPPTRLEAATVRQVLGPEVGGRVLAEPAWPALAAQLRLLERQGLDPRRALADAAARRELGSARSVAATLQHRLTRAASRPAEQASAPPRVTRPAPDRSQPAVPGRGR